MLFLCSVRWGGMSTLSFHVRLSPMLWSSNFCHHAVHLLSFMWGYICQFYNFRCFIMLLKLLKCTDKNKKSTVHCEAFSRFSALKFKLFTCVINNMLTRYTTVCVFIWIIFFKLYFLCTWQDELNLGVSPCLTYQFLSGFALTWLCFLRSFKPLWRFLDTH